MGSLTVALCGYLLSVPLPLQLHQLISGVQVQGRRWLVRSLGKSLIP
jgi:hypothetical protein